MNETKQEKQFKVEQILNFIKNVKRIFRFDIFHSIVIVRVRAGRRSRCVHGRGLHGCRRRRFEQMNKYPSKIHFQFDIYLVLALRLRFAISIKCKTGDKHTADARRRTD